MAFSDLLNKPFSELTKAQFLSFLQNQFLKGFFTPVFDKDNVVANYVRDLQFIKQVNILWSADDLEDLIVLEIIKQNKWDSRVWLTSEIFKLISNNDFLNKPRFNVLAIVRSEKDSDQWRLSLITSEWKIRSNPRRFSFLLWENEKVRTPKQQLIDLGPVVSRDDLKERFNAEVVRKEFFKLYINLFLEVYDAIITNDVFNWIIKKKQVEPISFAKNLMWKIVFLHFIQKKWWLWITNEDWKFWEWDRKFFKKNLDKLTTKWDLFNKRTNFYNDFLEPLFYDGLNKEHTNDRNENLQMKIPYLNWWLFQEEYDWEHTAINLDNDIFRAIIEAFDVYNFTIDEWDIYDREIAVDPEMLWKLFESMIWFNIDNQEDVNRVLEEYKAIKKKKKIIMPSPEHIIDLDLWKDKNKKLWAFYTPREIVWYMTRESIIEYLVSKLGEESRNTIRQLFKYKDEYLSKQEIETKANEVDNQLNSLETKITYTSLKHDVFDILEHLDEIKVLDPAVGSWAFPMWILQELVSLKEYLINVFWLEKKSTYEIKRDIIQNNIFWVDIDPWAVDIAKLRFWLWLVVDEEKPEPLPNLDFKFICADSLIPLAEKNEDEQDEFTKEANLDTLRKYKREYYNESDAKKKKQLAERIKNYRSESNNLFLSISSTRTQQISEFLSNFNMSEHVHSFFDPKLMFSEWNWFDIVIGNPPYIDSESMSKSEWWEYRERVWAHYSFTKWNWDIYIAFFEKWFISLNNNWILSFITPDKWTWKDFWNELRKNLLWNFISITMAWRKVFENAKVDSIISFISKKEHDKITILKYKWENNLDKLRDFDKSEMVSPYYFDYLFSSWLEIIKKIDCNKDILSNLAICENACATSDAYLLEPIVENWNHNNDNYKLINTWTIWKYIDRRWQKEITYLWKKLMYPICKKTAFHKKFPNSYWAKPSKIKLIWKWLNLLDVCIDEYWDTIPGKSTWMITSEDTENLYFLLALLNTKIVFYYIKEKYSASSYNGGTTFTKDMINNLPIPHNYVEVFNDIIDIVKNILTLKKRDPWRDTTDLERQIDQIVYKLYWLTDEEIKIIEDNIE